MLEYIKHKVAFALLTTKSFRTLRWFGVHVTPVHFYSPVPDIRDFANKPQMWQRQSELLGINMHAAAQQQLMQVVFSQYQSEWNFPSRPTDDPFEYYTQNAYFGFVSAAAMHAMIRHFRPHRIVEIGAGNSTRLIARAARLNAAEGHPIEVTAIDPYPSQALYTGIPGVTRLIPRKIQDVEMDVITILGANDILSIDTSHVVKVGGDVVKIYFDLLPRLAPGVLVHIHDIFLPFEYPRQWLQQRYFWNEQYLLRAFLMYNTEFEVVWGQKYSEQVFLGLYADTFSYRVGDAENYNSYSFWIRRLHNQSKNVKEVKE